MYHSKFTISGCCTTVTKSYSNFQKRNPKDTLKCCSRHFLVTRKMTA